MPETERLRYAGFAEETEFSPTTPPAAAFHIDIASATLDVPSDQTMVYGGGRGRAPRVTRPGFYSTEGNVVYAIDINTVGWFLKWVLGGYAFTADGGDAANHNLHEMWGSNSVMLPSFTTRLGKDIFEHVFRGCVANSFQLAIEDEFAMATMDIVGAQDSRADILEPGDLVLPEGFPLAFHDFTASIAGTDRSAFIKSFTIEINNNQDAEAGRGLGSRYPYRIIAGEREITITMNMYWNTLDELQRFWGGSEGPSDIAQEEFALTLTGAAGGDGGIEIFLPRGVYSQVQQQPSGRDELVQSVTYTAYQGTVTLEDASEVETDILVSLENEESELAVA